MGGPGAPLPGAPGPTASDAAVELWLVRHGQTVANEEGRFSGWSNVALTAQGEAEARALAPLFSGVLFEGVWSSDLGRALATARLAWGEPRPDARLRELHFGALEGQRWADLDPALRQSLLDFDGFSAPGGESLAAFEHRLRGFLSTLPPGRHLLFTHGGVVRLLTRGLGVDRFLPNGVVVGLDWTAQRLLFVREASQAPERSSPER